MTNGGRLGISALVSAVVTVTAYMLPFTLLLYFFAPGFWLGNALPDSMVDSLGGYLFPVFASAIIWAILIFVVWLLFVRLKDRSYK